MQKLVEVGTRKTDHVEKFKRKLKKFMHDNNLASLICEYDKNFDSVSLVGADNRMFKVEDIEVPIEVLIDVPDKPWFETDETMLIRHDIEL